MMGTNMGSELDGQNIGKLSVIILFGWRDGPLEGVLRDVTTNVCWYFRLIAERLESAGLDDRLFGLRIVPGQNSAVLIDEFGSDHETHVWPSTGGLGSVAARRVVGGLLATRMEGSNLIVRTTDFAEISGVWDVVSS
jgi:hypothetical protein